MKNTIKIISMLSAAVLCSATAFAETDKPASLSWIDNFTVGADSDSNPLSDNKEASITFTSPKDGKDSYDVKIGVSYLLMETERWTVSPVIEYNRNTALKKEQDVISAGIAGSYCIGDPAAVAIWTDGDIRYKWDGVKDDESWMPSLTFTPLYSPLGLGSSFGVSDLLRIQPVLSGGFVYEEASIGEDGDTLRAKVKADVAFIPQGVLKDNKLTFTLSNTYWNELTASGKFDDGKDDFNLLEIAATYYLINDKKNNDRLGVQLTYQDGANPETGREDQSLITFGFVFSL